MNPKILKVYLDNTNSDNNFILDLKLYIYTLKIY